MQHSHCNFTLHGPRVRTQICYKCLEHGITQSTPPLRITLHPLKHSNLPITMKEPIPRTIPSSKPLRFLVIGAGSRGNAYARAVTTATSGTIHSIAEPHAFKRRDFGKNYIWTESSSEGQEFSDWREWVAWEVERRKRQSQNPHVPSPPGVDGIFICTLDETHVEIVRAIAPLRLHILCEKPLALSLDDCLSVYRTLQPPDGSGIPARPTNIFSIGHVLRYSPHNIRLRKLLADRAIGDIVSLEHCEPVGWWHFSHSYVRGNWRRATAAGDGSLLTKSCHDIDFILWLLCSPLSSETDPQGQAHKPHFPRSISSAGMMTQFRRARKPVAAGDATNCLSCPVERDCNYSAVRIYNDRHLATGHTAWPVDIVCPDIEDVFRVQGGEAAQSLLLSHLGEDYDRATVADEIIASRPWYGRCVYEADNNVCDDQVVTIAWDDEETAPHRLAKTASFHMIAPTEKQCERRGRVYGTTGEISYDSHTISIYDFATAKSEVIHVPKPPPDQKESHGGGDYGLARQFVSAVEAVENGLDVETAQAQFVGCSLEEAVRSHAVVFAAEEARREETVVKWESWWDAKLKASAAAFKA